MRAYILFFFLCGWVYGQTPKPVVSMVTPNAASLGMYGQVPVSLFSGTPSVSVPLYELKEGPLTVPISLSYHASGIRPDQHPGWTGLNWSLQAGGSISRIVKGYPDETIWVDSILLFTNQLRVQNAVVGRMLHLDALRTSNWSTTNGIVNLARQDFESEADEFVFNVNGMSGKFYQAENGQWVVEADRTIKVEMDPLRIGYYPLQYVRDAYKDSGGFGVDGITSPSEFRIPGFRLTTADGTQYEFGYWNMKSTFTNVPVEASTNFFQQDYHGQKYDTWYLRRIVSANGKHTVDFTYQPGHFVASFAKTITLDKKEGSLSPSSGLFEVFGPLAVKSKELKEYYDGRLMLPVYLTKIETSTQEITFHTSPTKELEYNYDAIQDNLALQADKTYTPQRLGFSARAPIACWATDLLAGKPGVRWIYRKDMNQVNQNGHNFIVSRLLDAPNTPRRTGLFSLPGRGIIEGIDFSLLQWYKLDQLQVKYKPTQKVLRTCNFSYSASPTERLLLLAVNQGGEDGKQLPPYSFSYEDYNSNDYPGNYTLPPYNSYQVDHWGFFNGRDARQGLDFENPATLEAFHGKKEPVAAYLYTRMLTKIVYPTGGFTQFVFEPHTYAKVVTRNSLTGAFGLRSENSEKIAGGLRIKEIRSYTDANTLALTKKYTYTNGILGGENQYYWPFYRGYVVESANFYNSARFSTETILPMSSNSAGSHVGYSKVTEWVDGNGKTEYTYTNQDTNPDGNFINSIDIQKSPYAPVTNNSQQRGLLRTVSHYNEQGQLLSQEENTYAFNSSANYGPIRTVKTQQISVLEGTSIEATAYTINTYPYNKTSTTTTIYDVINPAKKQISVREYGYNAYNQLAQVLESRDKYAYQITRYRYVSDYVYTPITNYTQCYQSCYDEYQHCLSSYDDPTDVDYEFNIQACAQAYQYCLNNRCPAQNVSEQTSALLAMKAKNILSPVVSELLVSGKGVTTGYIGGKLNLYREFTPGNFQLQQTLGLNLSELSTDYNYDVVPFIHASGKFTYSSSYDQPLVTFQQYDIKGNPVQYTTENHVAVSYLWGYNKMYPVAEIKNATYAQIQAALGIQGELDLGISGLSEAQKTALRDNLPIEAVITTYDYQPMIGVVKVTDSKGHSTSYNYDTFQRLWQVLDTQSMPVQRIDYHYR